jgi:hypothetical protein
LNKIPFAEAKVESASDGLSRKRNFSNTNVPHSVPSVLNFGIHSVPLCVTLCALCVTFRYTFRNTLCVKNKLLRQTHLHAVAKFRAIRLRHVFKHDAGSFLQPCRHDESNTIFIAFNF